MSAPDLGALRAALVAACRAAVPEARRLHPDLYCWALYCAPNRAYIYPTAMSEAGFAQVRREYAARGFGPEYDAGLRWNPPHHWLGLEHFAAVQPLAQAVGEAINGAEGADWERLYARVDAVLCEALDVIEAEGLFGVGAERERLFVGILMGDQDATSITFGYRLNPPAVAARYEAEFGDPKKI